MSSRSATVPGALVPRLLAGPPLGGRAESFHSHLARLGPVPAASGPSAVIGELEEAGLLGRGGAGFPVGRKWRAVSDQRHATPVVVANGAEGEPESAKDRVLMAHRPHLVLDGALLAADAVGADRIELYLGREHGAAVAAMRAAVAERSTWERRLLHLVEAPLGYVAGEATAAVHYLNRRSARPMTTPPRMIERGVGNRPTLVQNVESLAHAALIARFGAAWYRQAGRGPTRGTALVTIGGSVRHPGVLEIEFGSALGEVVDRAGGLSWQPRAVLLGGYFGTWSRIEEAWDQPLDPAMMLANGLSFGCGMIGVLGAGECALARVAEIAAFLAAASAGQCGPCRFGLPAIAAAVGRLAADRPRPDDDENVATWTNLVRGRGACRHPDGAAQHLSSALRVFTDEFESHQLGRRCPAVRLAARVA